MAYTTPGSILFRYLPGVGRVAVSACQTPGYNLGNVAVVDTIYGNDSTGSVGGSPFKTVNKAVSSVSSGQTVWIQPGTYTITSPLVLPNGVSMRGLSLQTVVLRADVTSSFTMLTMGESCRVEDLSLTLNCTGSTPGVSLIGVLFGGTTSQTSKLRTAVVTVNNSTMGTALTSTVTGVQFSGTGSLTASTFSFNSVKGSTINVISNGAGNKRGILVSGTNQASTRDTNVYVAQPTDTASTGSYVGIETNDPGNTGSIQIRATTAGVVTPTAGQGYSASDILQTTPGTITNPTYLASPGIQVGPGSDLVTKSAGSKGFSTYVYPTVIYYGLKGNISSGTNGYLWPGTQAISAGTFPDSGIPAAYYRVQQPCILAGMSAALTTPPGTTNTVNLTVYSLPAAANNATAANYTGYISGTTLTVSTGPTFGSIAIGQSVGLGQPYVSGNIQPNTYIVSGSGSTWTVYPSQTLGSSGSPVALTNAAPVAAFTGSISGTTLTVSGVTGALGVGQYVAASGVAAGTNISSQLTPTTYQVSISQTVSSRSMNSVGQTPTVFTVTFTDGDIQKTFYDASARFNTGDNIIVYLSYTGAGANLAHDLTVQLDLF